MADRRSVSDRYARIGAELVETEELLAPIRRSEATIVYLASGAEKRSHGRAVLGQCERVPDRWKWAVPADFRITVLGYAVRPDGPAKRESGIGPQLTRPRSPRI